MNTLVNTPQDRMSSANKIQDTSTYATTTAIDIQGAVRFTLREGSQGSPNQWQVQIDLFNTNPQNAGAVPVATQTLSLEPQKPVPVTVSGGGIALGPDAYLGIKGLGLLFEGTLVTPALTTMLNGCIGVFGEAPGSHLSRSFQLLPGTAEPCNMHLGVEWQASSGYYIAHWQLNDSFGQQPLVYNPDGYCAVNWSDGDFSATGTIMKTPGSWTFNGVIVRPNQASIHLQNACFAGWVSDQ